MRVFLFLLVITFFVGCVTLRTYEIEKPRVDTDIEGNQGYLSGDAVQTPAENRLGDTRKISVVEIEFRKSKAKEKQVQESETEDYLFKDDTFGSELAIEDNSEFYAEDTQTYQDYTVSKSDTLQKISYKFYGTTKKWKKIYDANKDVIKNSDKVYPGTKIRIPLSE